MSKYTGFEIAVIGMAGRFPGAEDLDCFWNNLKNGVESISFFSADELLEEGEDPALMNNPSYVPANAFIANKEYFDSAFFNYRSDEAKLMDPQMRILHECVWQAIEDAGYDVSTYKNRIGLFTGATPNLNWENYTMLANGNNLMDEFSASLLRHAGMNNSRISYLLNLRGPSVSIYTACSTSLVAIHQACNSLLLGECTLALAGGVSITNRSKKGYLYKEGMIVSGDGHCRTFDAAASGTVGGEGVGVVVLKKLNNALADKDNILAVIKGTGVNNDGKDKVGYTAPGVNGQTEVIMMSRKMAKIEAESISYIEAHGTATTLGDPIEVEALQRAFGYSKDKYCALGSVKTNIGHLDAAAGIAGFIKTVLALKNRQIPPSLHFKTPNPNIEFNNTPFYVNTALIDWRNDKYPLRAGVSSFGIGGTNAHIILEEAPQQEPSSRSRSWQLLVFSAKTLTALEENSRNFIRYLEGSGETKLSDIAYTLQTGRAPFGYRKAIVCKDKKEAIERLKLDNALNNPVPAMEKARYPVVFMFSGQGSQYVNMCAGLYKKETEFREEADRCFDIVKKLSGKDLKFHVFPNEGTEELSKINETEFTQPILFVLEYALARLLMKWGIRPDIMIGHSIGEYVAACISGVFSLEDALTLVIKRAGLMQEAPEGIMLGVSISENELIALLDKQQDISIAAVNSTSLCVVSGEEKAVHRFRSLLEDKGYKTRVIRTSHAFHSSLMDGLLSRFEKVAGSIKMNPRQIPFISNLSGKYATDEEIMTPAYWVSHLRQPVLFSKGIAALLEHENAFFIEVGPGIALSTFVRSHQLRKKEQKVVSLIRHPDAEDDDWQHLLSGIGELWLNGIEPDWKAFYKDESRKKISLPAYSFDKTKYAVNVDAYKLIVNELRNTSPAIEKGIAKAIHTSFWRTSLSPNAPAETKDQQVFVVFAGNERFSRCLIESLHASGQRTIEVRPAPSFRQTGIDVFEADVLISNHLDTLWRFLAGAGIQIGHIVYCAALTDSPRNNGYDDREGKLRDGYLGLSYVASSIENNPSPGKKQLTIINNYLASVLEEDEVDPLKATIHGPSRIIPLEMLQIKSRLVDIPYPFHKDTELYDYTLRVINELFYETAEPFVAYRHRQRWVQAYDILTENEKLGSGLQIVRNATYIITGGMGGMGFALAGDLVKQHGANVILLHRSAFPDRTEWDNWLFINGEQDPISKKIGELREMERTGRHIDLVHADVSIEEQVKNFSLGLKDKNVKIDGLIWAAGEVDYGGIILNREKKDFIKYVSSKVDGLLLFEKYLDFAAMDFIALFSSVGNVFYQSKFGQVAYNAANEFLESYPYYAAKKFGTAVFTINWSDWQDVGMTFRTVMKQEKTHDTHLINSRIPNAISPKEGIAIFHRCLHSKAAVFTIYKGNIAEAIESYGQNHVKDRGEPALLQEPTGRSGTEKRTTEERLMEIFSLFFDKSDVRPGDDFFELGGDSLKILTIIYRIQNEFDVELSIKDIFNSPSIRELGRHIDSLGLKPGAPVNGMELSEAHRLS